MTKETDDYCIELLYNGDIIVSKNGKVYNKLGNEIGFFKKNWGQKVIKKTLNKHVFYIPVSRLMWFMFKGDILPGQTVTFKDGNKLNLTLDNLILETRSELNKKSHPPDYKKIEKIKEMVQNNKGLVEIARFFSVTTTAICNLIKKYKIEYNYSEYRNKVFLDRAKIIIKYIQNGKSYSEIYKALGLASAQARVINKQKNTIYKNMINL